MKIPDYSKKKNEITYLEMIEEIERLTAESTKWESKFYDEAKKVDKAIEYIEDNKSYTTIEKWVAVSTYKKVDEDILDEDMINTLLDILKGSE